MAKSDAAQQASQGSGSGGAGGLKKINLAVKDAFHDLNLYNIRGTVRLMFQDEASFGRINKPKYCWCIKGLRPVVPCHHIREYRYCFGAVEPKTGESFFLIMPWCNTKMMNLFLEKLSQQYPDDIIVLVCDCAGWHRSDTLVIPENIRIMHLPPATPEMNPIEQIWRELRLRGFRNEIFPTLEKVVDRLCLVIQNLRKSTVQSITARSWILDCF